jgi:hypothetical protein
MTTINLYQNQEDKNRISSQNANRGLFLSLGILSLTVIIAVGLKIYTPILDAKNKALIESISAENEKTVGLKKLTQVMDIQNRLVQIKNNLQIQNSAVTRTDMNKILDKLSLDLDSGIVVADFKYNGDIVDVSFDANNFSDAAKQILNFKKSDYFSEINLNSIARKENVVNVSVSMKYKKS